MASSGIRVSGVKQLEGRLTNAAGKIDRGTIVVLRRAAVRVRRRQKELAPELSGDLKKSISYQIRGTRWRRTAVVGPKLSKKYAIYQEVGTARMRANPYVQPSLNNEDQRIADDLNKLLRESMR